MEQLLSMNKSSLKRVLVFTFLFSVMLIGLNNVEKASAENPASDFTYTINSTTNEVSITGYKGTTTDVIIPKTIEGKPVTSISGLNPLASKGLTSLVLPEGLKVIGSGSFMFNNLTSVVIPSTVIDIGSSAFSSNKITNITVPDTVTSIGSYAFSFNNLTKAEIRKDVSYGMNVYANNLITDLTIEEGVKLIPRGAVGTNLLTKVNIPTSVTKIGERAFEDNQITEIDLPDGLVELDNYAFLNNKIKEIKFPYSYKELWRNVFETNKLSASEITIYAYDNQPSVKETAEAKGYKFVSLGSTYTFKEPNPSGHFEYTKTGNEITITKFNSSKVVWIPDTIEGLPVTSIGNNAFTTMYMETVKLPSTLKTIGVNAFYNNNLKEIIIPEGVTSIGKSAFSYGKLEKVTLPSTLTTVGESAFQVNSILELTVPGSLKEIGSYSFANNKLKKVILENGVESTGRYGFANNEIDTLVLPETIISIRDFSFANNKIRDLKIPSSIDIIWDYAFSNNLIDKVILPEGFNELRNYAFSSNEVKELEIPKSLTVIPSDTLLSNRVTNPYEVIIVGYETPASAKNFANSKGYRFVSIDNPKSDDPETSRGKLKWSEVDILAGELSFEVPEIGLFNKIKLNAGVQKSYANLLGNAMVFDSRGSAEGWRVVVEATPFTTIINGTDYSLPSGRLNLKKPLSIKEVVTSNSTGLSIPPTTLEVPIDGMGPVAIATAEVGYGKGKTDIEFDLVNTLSLTLDQNEIMVDKNTRESKYVSTITWSLTEAP